MTSSPLNSSVQDPGQSLGVHSIGHRHRSHLPTRLDQQGVVQRRASYSSLARLPDGRVGVLYERDGDQRMTFSSFTLGWRTDLRE